MSKLIMELAGKVALITGAGQGIGKGIALVLAEKGADIIINDLEITPETEILAEQIRGTGRNVMVFKADVSDEQSVKEMFSAIKLMFGRLDILVNNAGTSQSKDIFQTTMEDWNFILKTNLTSCFLCAKEAMEMMKIQNYGRIINMGSVVGERGALYGHVHYAATKSGINGFSKTLAKTAAPYKINVNVIAPGIIETELLTKTHGEEGVNRLSDTVPLGLGKPRSIGLAAAFLCGEGGDYITGTTIHINGGMY